MKAKNCIVGLEVLLKVDGKDLYYMSNMNGERIPSMYALLDKGAVVTITHVFEDGTGDVSVQHSKYGTRIVNCKCLKMIKAS